MQKISAEYQKLVASFYHNYEAASVGGVSEAKEKLRRAARTLFEFERAHEVPRFREINAMLRKAEAELENARQQLGRWKRSKEGLDVWIGTRLGSDAEVQPTALDLLTFERLFEIGTRFLPQKEEGVGELRKMQAALVDKHDGLMEMIADPIARERGDFSHIEREVYAGK